MKEFLKKIIAAKEARMAEIKDLIERSESLDEVRNLSKEMDELKVEASEAREQLAKLENEGDGEPASPFDSRSVNPLGSYGQAGGEKREDVDPTDTVEYRTAFMEYVCRGTAFPDELRADTITTTTDAGILVPKTVLTEIIRKMDTYGNIYAKVRKLNIKGGVEVPILDLKPEATWISADTGTKQSDLKKIEAKTKVSFTYHGIECKIARTLLVGVTALDAFQDLFVELATEAVIRAVEKSIISGTGSGQPLGITKDTRVPSGNVIELTAAEMGDWGVWQQKVVAKMKKAYRRGDYIMEQGTFDAYINGMTDNDGQPIGRTNYGIDGGETYRFGGKNVETVEEEVIANFDTASAGDVIAIFADLSDYAVNSNMEMTVVEWEDHDNNAKKTKAIMIVDGKLLDPNGVIIIKKKVAGG